MGKANRVKKDLAESIEMVTLVQTLKDIADNKYFTLSNQKSRFRRFADTFVEFFRMISQTNVEHPLVSNKNPATVIIAMTMEGSFLGPFNGKIIRLAIDEKEKYPEMKFIAVGEKAIEPLSAFTPDLKSYINFETQGLYETALSIKNYLIDEMMNDRLGRVIICHSWPISFEIQKTRAFKLLPCDELLTQQVELVDIVETVIQESDPVEVIGYLSNLWITTRIYEVLVDTIIAGAAAQSQFLEDSVDRMKKLKQKTLMAYRKARKSDIDKSLRETFSARMMSMK